MLTRKGALVFGVHIVHIVHMDTSEKGLWEGERGGYDFMIITKTMCTMCTMCTNVDFFMVARALQPGPSPRALHMWFCKRQESTLPAETRSCAKENGWLLAGLARVHGPARIHLGRLAK